MAEIAKKPINVEEVLMSVMQLPVVNVDRASFLRKELSKYCSEEVVNKAIETNPAFAGVAQETINKLANDVIGLETTKVSTVSLIAGLPGGVAMVATVPADIAQYFGYSLIVLQKLAYLYGFQEIDFKEGNIDDGTMTEVIVLLGVMLGVNAAGNAIDVIAKQAAKAAVKKLPQKALTKGVIYPIVKKIATALGVKMTKEIFAKGVGKIIPFVGGVISGGLTFVTFLPSCKRLQKKLKTLDLSNPDKMSHIADDVIEVDGELVE